jgi:hypothetical protein
VRDATQESSRQAANARACHENEKTGEHSHESSLTYRFAALLLIGKRFPNYWRPGFAPVRTSEHFPARERCGHLARAKSGDFAAYIERIMEIFQIFGALVA